MTNFLPLAWHPWSGCSPISPSCSLCHGLPRERGDLVDITKRGPVFNGKLRFNEDQTNFPATLESPSMITVCPHGDVFHENAPETWLDNVFDVMEANAQHVYTIVTKRSERMLSYLEKRYPRSLTPLHIAIGVSAERQREANRRVADLLDAPVSFKWLTFFSLFEPIEVTAIPGATDSRMATIRQVMLGGSLDAPDANPGWYADIQRYFENLGILVTNHVLADEAAKRGW